MVSEAVYHEMNYVQGLLEAFRFVWFNCADILRFMVGFPVDIVDVEYARRGRQGCW